MAAPSVHCGNINTDSCSRTVLSLKCQNVTSRQQKGVLNSRRIYFCFYFLMWTLKINRYNLYNHGRTRSLTTSCECPDTLSKFQSPNAPVRHRKIISIFVNAANRGTVFKTYTILTASAMLSDGQNKLQSDRALRTFVQYMPLALFW